MAAFRYSQLNPYDLHKRLINEYMLKRPGDTALLRAAGRDSRRDRTDADVLRDNHRFLWTEEDDDPTTTESTSEQSTCPPTTSTTTAQHSWEQQLARRYYDKLFKEYGICDLSRYRENRVALRWRTQTEVVEGRGQFSCAAKGCAERSGLRSWEVNFAYVERGQRRNALVKVRLCPACSERLNYRSAKREVKRMRRTERSARRISRRVRREEAGSLLTPSRIKRSESTMTTDVDEAETTDGEQEAKIAAASKGSASAQKSEEGGCWTKAAAASAAEEKSREEEFDEYLEDLLL